MSRAFVLGAAAIVSSVACGGDRLLVGFDDERLAQDPSAPVDLDAVQTRCSKSAGPPTPEGRGEDEKRQQARAMLIGRWFACRGSEIPLDVPNAIEFTESTMYTLVDRGDHVYERGPETPYSVPSWSAGLDGISIAFRSRTYVARFNRNPLTMTFPVTTGARFVKN